MSALDALLSDRLIDETPTNAGQVVAELWQLGFHALQQMGISLSEEMHTEYQLLALQVVRGDRSGRDLLIEVLFGFDDDAQFLDLLHRARDWNAMESTRNVVARRAAKLRRQTDLLDRMSAIGGFELIELLGQGAFGQVYKALQVSLDRPVAIKVLSPELQEDGEFVGRLREEAKVAARLHHPNVVGVIEQGTCELSGVEFIAFEYVDGETGKDLLRKGKLPEKDALTICLAVAEALACAEGLEIVHRDVKPENILIGLDGIPKLADLGLARRLDEVGTGTRSGFVVGTPHYISPEQAMGEKLDIRTDLYSLGVCLFRFLSATVPLPSTSPMGIVARHVNEELPDVRTVDPLISQHAAQLIRWLSARDRDERYPTAGDAANSLRGVLDGKPPISPKEIGSGIQARKATVRRGPASIIRDEDQDVADEDDDEDETPTNDGRFGKGRGFYDDEFLFDELQAGDESRYIEPPGDDPDMLLSEDGSRVYQILECLSDSPSGQVFDAAVMGNQTFESFRDPVLAVIVKVSARAEGHAVQRALLAQPDRRLPTLLDTGLAQGERPYLVLERLLDHPSQRFGGDAGRIRVDAGTAVETFVNLLESLKGIHFRRTSPLVLCDVRPGGIKLRMKTSDGTLNDREYLERIANGAYEPVFATLSGTLDRDLLRASGGRVKKPIGSPLYLPPESFPRAKNGGGYSPGTYSTATDTYSLCLTFYVHLTADRLYSSQGIYRVTGNAFLRELRTLKLQGTSPVDRSLLETRVGAGADLVAEVLAAGLHPNPQQRANPHKLLQMCKQRFGVNEARGKSESGVFGLRLRQTYFPRLVAGRNHYVKRKTPPSSKFPNREA